MWVFLVFCLFFFQAKQLKLLFSVHKTVGVVAFFAKECFIEVFKLNLKLSSSLLSFTEGLFHSMVSSAYFMPQNFLKAQYIEHSVTK